MMAITTGAMPITMVHIMASYRDYDHNDIYNNSNGTAI